MMLLDASAGGHADWAFRHELAVPHRRARALVFWPEHRRPTIATKSEHSTGEVLVEHSTPSRSRFPAVEPVCLSTAMHVSYAGALKSPVHASVTRHCHIHMRQPRTLLAEHKGSVHRDIG